MRILGIALVLVAVLSFVYGGITYTTRDKVIDAGPLVATMNEKHTIPLPPLVGTVTLLAGILLIAGERRRA